MENYPLYGEARVALSREETHRKIGLFDAEVPSLFHPQCAGICASLRSEDKCKSKPFQWQFSCKMGCILIEGSERVYALTVGRKRKETVNADRMSSVKLKHIMLLMFISDSREKTFHNLAN